MLYELDGHAPQVPANGDFWVAPGAHVLGKVVLAEGVSVWFGCTLRGDNEPLIIGAGTNIQENCVLHTDMGYPLTIGADCTIGHKAMLHGCTIGDGSLKGMGATILNGAVIGRGCLIGAGALVTEGKVIPDFSLVMGSPGRIVRELDEAARAKLRTSATNYRANMNRFKAGLRALD